MRSLARVSVASSWWVCCWCDSCLLLLKDIVLLISSSRKREGTLISSLWSPLLVIVLRVVSMCFCLPHFRRLLTAHRRHGCECSFLQLRTESKLSIFVISVIFINLCWKFVWGLYALHSCFRWPFWLLEVIKPLFYDERFFVLYCCLSSSLLVLCSFAIGSARIKSPSSALFISPVPRWTVLVSEQSLGSLCLCFQETLISRVRSLLLPIGQRVIIQPGSRQLKQTNFILF